ncbi:hypothetical protein D3C73_748750 [compost metagenome]
MFESAGLLLKVITGEQGGLEILHAFLVEGFDLGDVHIQRVDYSGLLFSSSGYRLIYAINFANTLSNAP